MAKLNNTETLKEAIVLLKVKRLVQEEELKEIIHETAESLKPMNLLKSSFSSIIHTPDLKSTILKSILGLAVGFISKKILVGKSSNPLRSLLGALLQVGVASSIAKDPEEIKAVGKKLAKMVFAKEEA